MRLRALFALTAATAILACSETAAPPSDPSAALDRTTPHHVAPAIRGQYAARGATLRPGGSPGTDDTDGPVEPGFSASSSGNDDLFVTSFWAVQGEGHGIQIYYRETENDPWAPYELFYVYPQTQLQLPDGSNAAPGDSVLITLSIDATQMVTTYGPSGLQFNTVPSYLKKWYTAANGDFDGDGDADADDAYIEQNLLDMWTQDGSSLPWSMMTAEHSVSGQWLKVRPEHFSGYAISW